MNYLHSNGSFLVVKTYIDNLAQIGMCTFKALMLKIYFKNAQVLKPSAMLEY